MRLHTLELYRVKFGPYNLGNLPPGAVREVKVNNLLLQKKRNLHKNHALFLTML